MIIHHWFYKQELRPLNNDRFNRFSGEAESGSASQAVRGGSCGSERTTFSLIEKVEAESVATFVSFAWMVAAAMHDAINKDFAANPNSEIIVLTGGQGQEEYCLDVPA